MDQPPIIDPDLLDKVEVSGFLKEIQDHVRDRVAQRRLEVPVAGLRALCTIQKRPLDLTSVLRRKMGLSLVVEIKRQSANGMVFFPERYNPVELAKLYEAAGAHAVSIATNAYYFQGDVYHLMQVKEDIHIPVLRRDFVFDEYQVYEARAAGADGVFLLAALMGENRLRNLISLTQRLRMTAIVQVQDEIELARAMTSDPRVIGITNLDARTFEIDLERTPRLRRLIPPHIVTISMGGIRTPEDIVFIADSGVDGVQIGESLLSSNNVLERLRWLFSGVEVDPDDLWYSAREAY